MYIIYFCKASDSTDYYIADWTQGDPPLTSKIENARRYKTEASANKALIQFESRNKHRSFAECKIIKI